VAVDELGFVKAYGRLHKRVVQRVPDGADRAGDAGVEQRLGENYGRILRAGIGIKLNSG
jgi:hypothetical protein